MRGSAGKKDQALRAQHCLPSIADAVEAVKTVPTRARPIGVIAKAQMRSAIRLDLDHKIRVRRRRPPADRAAGVHVVVTPFRALVSVIAGTASAGVEVHQVVRREARFGCSSKLFTSRAAS